MPRETKTHVYTKIDTRIFKIDIKISWEAKAGELQMAAMESGRQRLQECLLPHTAGSEQWKIAPPYLGMGSSALFTEKTRMSEMNPNIG